MNLLTVVNMFNGWIRLLTRLKGQETLLLLLLKYNKILFQTQVYKWLDYTNFKYSNIKI